MSTKGRSGTFCMGAHGVLATPVSCLCGRCSDPNSD